MGVNRNGDRMNLIIQSFDDKRVCKYELAGLCPYKLFPNTKQDLGKCPYECCPVPEKFKKEYEDEKQNRNISRGFEKELEDLLTRLVEDCDDRISRAQRRLEAQKKNAITNEPIELRNVRTEMEAVTKQVEELFNSGQVEESQKLLERIEALNAEKDAIEQKMPQTKEQQLIVCEICAALLSVNESDQRLADHFAGKMHLGFQRVRDKLKELKDLRTFEARRQRDTTGRERGDIPAARERDLALWSTPSQDADKRRDGSSTIPPPSGNSSSSSTRSDYRDSSRRDFSYSDRSSRDSSYDNRRQSSRDSGRYSDSRRERDRERDGSSSRYRDSYSRYDDRDRGSSRYEDSSSRKRRRERSEDPSERSPSPHRKL
ncbi:Luc7l2 [Acrasis kona]|uniref:Luc7l2 n=1 Tax=Acrasis kona TaxID=1008807 RepID=A0AAW2ZD76_9EUKA